MVRDLSLMRISYKLTKTTTKAEKKRKILIIFKMYSIKSFESKRYKLTALRKTIQSILNHKLVRPVSILWLPKVQKTG